MAAYTVEEYRSKFIAPQVRVTRRAEILEADGKTLWEEAGTDPRLIGGNVSVDYSRDERRSLDLELANFDSVLIHRPQGFWYDKILRVYRGIEFRDADGLQKYEEPLGKYVIDRVVQKRFPDTVNITARDYTKKCLLSKFIHSTSFPADTTVKELIDALAANCGAHDRVIPDDEEELGTVVTFDRGLSRWEAMKQVANAHNYELFFDARGYLIMRKYLDPTTSPVNYEFVTGPTVGNLVDWEKSTNDTRVFNWISVVGADSDSIPVHAEAKNENNSSPTSIDNIGPRVYPFPPSGMVTTTEQAQELADSLLKINGLEEYEISMTSLVIPWLEAGEIVRFTDPEAPSNDPDRFLLTSCSIPLGLGAMSAVGRRITIIG